MDLTDVTIPPMIPVGILLVSRFIQTHTGWGWIASLAAGVIPGYSLGMGMGMLLFLAISWAAHRAREREKLRREARDGRDSS